MVNKAIFGGFKGGWGGDRHNRSPWIRSVLM